MTCGARSCWSGTWAKLMGQKKDFVDAGGGSCRLLCTSDRLSSDDVWILLWKCSLSIKGNFMSRSARDFTKFLFTSSLSDFRSRKENHFAPKSNNFPAGIRGYFHCVFYLIRYICTETWGKCKAATYLKKRSVETSDKLRCLLHKRLISASGGLSHYSSNRLDLVWILA